MQLPELKKEKEDLLSKISAKHQLIESLVQNLERERAELVELKTEYHKIDKQLAMIDGRFRIISKKRTKKECAKQVGKINKPKSENKLAGLSKEKLAKLVQLLEEME